MFKLIQAIKGIFTREQLSYNVSGDNTKYFQQREREIISRGKALDVRAMKREQGMQRKENKITSACKV